MQGNRSGSRLNQTAGRKGINLPERAPDRKGQRYGELVVCGRIGTRVYRSGGTEHKDPVLAVKCVAAGHRDARSARSLRYSGDRARCTQCASLRAYRDKWRGVVC